MPTCGHRIVGEIFHRHDTSHTVSTIFKSDVCRTSRHHIAPRNNKLQTSSIGSGDLRQLNGLVSREIIGFNRTVREVVPARIESEQINIGHNQRSSGKAGSMKQIDIKVAGGSGETVNQDVVVTTGNRREKA